MAELEPFPPGPYTEEQLQLLERGWHGRPTMQTVVAEVRRLMAHVSKLESSLELAELEYQNRYRSGR